MLQERLRQVRDLLHAACIRAGRSPEQVTLIAVTKGVPAERIREAVALGVTDLGENRVQEAREKQHLLSGLQARWHLIGHLQRNKATHAVELFDYIHSVDSVELAHELERQSAKRQHPLEVLVQVNVSGESTKFGCRDEQAHALASTVQGMARLRLAGFMTIAPFDDDPEQARPHFAHLRALRDREASQLGMAPEHLKLSMGMSHDFEVAIEEGADWVRIGTAIFGVRA